MILILFWKKTYLIQFVYPLSLPNKLYTIFSSPDGREGTCLSQLTLPALWWPSMTSISGSDLNKSTSKQPKVNIKVSYSVFETKGKTCIGDQGKHIIKILQGFLINLSPLQLQRIEKTCI